MRREWIVGIAAAVGVSLLMLVPRGDWPQARAADERDNRHTITTSGSATVTVKPDSARVFFGLSTTASSVKAARDQNAEKMKEVMAALTALKIPGLKMKTANVSFVPAQSAAAPGRPAKTIGFKAVHSFTVLVQDQDPDRLGALAARVLDTGVEHGANIVDQLVFFKQDDKDARREALTRAVEDGLENARALARGGNTRIRETVEINGQPSYGMLTNAVQSNRDFGGATETTVVAGDIQVTCTVQVTCSF